jgi:hypothetical protein
MYAATTEDARMAMRSRAIRFYNIHTMNRAPKVFLWIATAFTALSALAVGALIGAKLGHRLWLWRDFQIIPQGWDPVELREAHEAVGSIAGFAAVLLLLIVCLWKGGARAGSKSMEHCLRQFTQAE